MAVGDDDQSIYAFRGAWATWPTSCASSTCSTRSSWSRTHRSYSNILDSANQLISHNSRRLGKTCAPDAGPGEPVRVQERPATDLAEAAVDGR